MKKIDGNEQSDRRFCSCAEGANSPPDVDISNLHMLCVVKGEGKKHLTAARFFRLYSQWSSRKNVLLNRIRSDDSRDGLPMACFLIRSSSNDLLHRLSGTYTELRAPEVRRARTETELTARS